ncbi:MAG: PQQ-binding-like beta-propeller repeat protein [Acidimicrobiales bacterium]
MLRRAFALVAVLAAVAAGCSRHGTGPDEAGSTTSSAAGSGATAPSVPGSPFGPPGDLLRQPDAAGEGTWWRTRTPAYGAPALSEGAVLLNYIEQPGLAGERRVGLAAYDVGDGRMRWHHATDCDLSAADPDGSVSDGASVWMCTPPQDDGPPQDPRIRAYDVDSGRELWRSDLAYEPFTGHVDVEGGRVLIVSVADFELRDARTGRVIVQGSDADDVDLGSDGLAVARGGGVDLLDLEGKVTRHLDRRCVRVFLAADGAVVGVDGGSVLRWEAGATAPAEIASLDDEEMAVALSADHLVTWVFDGAVRSRDLSRNGEETWRTEQASEAPPLVSGGRAAVDGGSGDHLLRDIATGRTVASTETGSFVVGQPDRAVAMSDVVGVTTFGIIPIDPD